MWSNTLRLYMLVFLFLISLNFTLLPMYSDLLDKPEVFSASLFYLPISFVMFAVAFRADFSFEKNSLIKYAYLIFYFIVTIMSLILVLIVLYNNPSTELESKYATYIFGSTAFISVASMVTIALKGRDEK